ncbi:MAG TPA: hypothetical protein VGI69_02055 [Gaiellaceae bacterium]
MKWFVAALIAVAAAAVPGTASAMPPTSADYSFSASVTLPAGVLCSFPIELDGMQSGTTTMFYDRNGVITQRDIHAFEQDTFTANGKTLQSDPYSFSLFHDYVDGVQVTSYGTGVAERVPLPNGSVYIVAGRVDFFTLPPAPILFVDSGNPGNNLDAFCAALS